MNLHLMQKRVLALKKAGIVTNGLVLNLDAGNPLSYPGTGTLWTDLSGNGNNGTLVNGPTFNSANGGSIVFDGVNDYVDNINQSIPIQFNTPFSSSIIFKTSKSTPVHLIGNWNTLVSGGWRSDIVSGKIRFLMLSRTGQLGIAVQTILSSYNNNSVYSLCCVYDGSLTVTGLKIYINDVQASTSTILNSNPGILTNSKITIAASQISTSNYVNYFSGNIYQSLLYNRALTPQEVLQNFNATKSRFGIT